MADEPVPASAVERIAAALERLADAASLYLTLQAAQLQQRQEPRPSAAPRWVPETFRIDPEVWYYEETLRICGLDDDSLKRARTKEGLRFKQSGRRRIYKGSWVIAWLEGTPQRKQS